MKMGAAVASGQRYGGATQPPRGAFMLREKIRYGRESPFYPQRIAWPKINNSSDRQTDRREGRKVGGQENLRKSQKLG